jgi:malate dehydrogenase (oxaloacetate-decarboxylating)
MEIKENPDAIFDYTMTSNSIAIITDGSLYPIEHQNELIPKLESQAALFKFFYNIDAFPFILDWNLCKTDDDILLIIENLATTYKVIDLKLIHPSKIKTLIPKLKAKNLPITVLYSGTNYAYILRIMEGNQL